MTEAMTSAEAWALAPADLLLLTQVPCISVERASYELQELAMVHLCMHEISAVQE